MRVMCIRGDGYHLTNGNIYDVSIVDYDSVFDYEIVNDRGYKHCVESDIFLELTEFRLIKLETLLDETT